MTWGDVSCMKQNKIIDGFFIIVEFNVTTVGIRII